MTRCLITKLFKRRAAKGCLRGKGVKRLQRKRGKKWTTKDCELAAHLMRDDRCINPLGRNVSRFAGLGAGVPSVGSELAPGEAATRLRKSKKPLPGASCVVVGKLPQGISIQICEGQYPDEDGNPVTAIQAFAFKKLSTNKRRVIAEVAALELEPYREGGKPRFKVGLIEVNPEYRKHRIGTRLYEHLLQTACAKGGVLVSDQMRSPFAEAFWRKQVAKKRAGCTFPGGSVFLVPLLELRDKLAPDEFVEVIEHLPAPEMHPTLGPRWPCGQYEMSCDVSSLDGLKSVGASKPPEELDELPCDNCGVAHRSPQCEPLLFPRGHWVSDPDDDDPFDDWSLQGDK